MSTPCAQLSANGVKHQYRGPNIVTPILLVTCSMRAWTAVGFFFDLDGAVFNVEFVMKDPLRLGEDFIMNTVIQNGNMAT